MEFAQSGYLVPLECFDMNTVLSILVTCREVDLAVHFLNEIMVCGGPKL